MKLILFIFLFFYVLFIYYLRRNFNKKDRYMQKLLLFCNGWRIRKLFVVSQYRFFSYLIFYSSVGVSLSHQGHFRNTLEASLHISNFHRAIKFLKDTLL